MIHDVLKNWHSINRILILKLFLISLTIFVVIIVKYILFNI